MAFAAVDPTVPTSCSTSVEACLSCVVRSAETDSKDCCVVRALLWMVSLVLSMRLVSEFSASSTCDLMPVDSSSARAIKMSLA